MPNAWFFNIAFKNKSSSVSKLESFVGSPVASPMLDAWFPSIGIKIN